MNELEQYRETMLAEISPLDATSREMLAAAQDQTITTDDELRAGNDLKGRINLHIKSVKDKRLALTRPIDALKNVLLSRESEILEPVNEAKAVLGKSILAYEEELERQRRVEEERVDLIVFEIQAHYKPGMTVAQVETAKAAGKSIRASLSAADAQIPRIKLALLTLSNDLNDRLADIDIEEQRAKKKKLEDDEARLQREKQELEARKERARIAQEQLDADKAAARAERDRPKSNIVETTEFEITDADVVPRALCSPDSTKIRMAIKAGATEIEGVRIFTTKKVR